MAPILNLPTIPPPPPLLDSGLSDPQCERSTASANLTAQWRQACEVIAYPPPHHVWNWSNPEVTVAVIRSTLGDRSYNFDQLLRLVDEEEKNISGCSGLLVPQNAFSTPHGPTLFWCYAENEVGASGIRWPQDYEEPGCEYIPPHSLS